MKGWAEQRRMDNNHLKCFILITRVIAQLIDCTFPLSYASILTKQCRTRVDEKFWVYLWGHNKQNGWTRPIGGFGKSDQAYWKGIIFCFILLLLLLLQHQLWWIFGSKENVKTFWIQRYTNNNPFCNLNNLNISCPHSHMQWHGPCSSDDPVVSVKNQYFLPFKFTSIFLQSWWIFLNC